MPAVETEWSMQKTLTASWLAHETVELHDEPFFLVAWEVMTTYKVNDARRHWNAPSIDFVFLDREGRMLLVELKRAVRTPREGWSVVCQVSHRAQALASGFSQRLLESVYLDCRSGPDGRTARKMSIPPLLRAHAEAFNQRPLRRLRALPARRMVMAAEFRPSFAKILSMANASTPEQVAEMLSRYKRTGEIKRYLELPLGPALVDERPIQAVMINGAPWPDPASSS